MMLFSWFNSPDQVDTALVWVAAIGAVIELGVAVAAVINVHKEIDELRKKKLEKYIEIFACVAAFFFLAEAILGWRSSALLAKDLENLKTDNLKLEAQIQPRRITREQRASILRKLKDLPFAQKCKVVVTSEGGDVEANVLMDQIFNVLKDSGYDVTEERFFIVNGLSLLGINFLVKSANPLPQEAADVIDALSILGQPGKIQIDPNMGMSVYLLDVQVGSKPIK